MALGCARRGRPRWLIKKIDDYNESHPHSGLGMISPREFIRAQANLAGCPVKRGQHQLGIKYETARTYLKSAFLKTGTHRQAELTPGDLPENRSGIRQWMYASVVALECFVTKASAMPFDSGLRTGVKHGTRPRAAAKSSVSLAVKGLPLSDSHSTACGAWIVAKRNSTACSIRSRTIEPLTPAPATACQASTSRSWASMTKTMRTISPFQQVISKTSEHQRRFERITPTLPSCRRPLRRPVWR